MPIPDNLFERTLSQVQRESSFNQKGLICLVWCIADVLSGSLSS